MFVGQHFRLIDSFHYVSTRPERVAITPSASHYFERIFSYTFCKSASGLISDAQGYTQT